jgi:hypothetical protein
LALVGFLVKVWLLCCFEPSEDTVEVAGDPLESELSELENESAREAPSGRSLPLEVLDPLEEKVSDPELMPELLDEPSPSDEKSLRERSEEVEDEPTEDSVEPNEPLPDGVEELDAE